jgi:hypothetical protein
MSATTDLMSRFAGRFDDIVLFGPTPDGIRMDGHFSGPITAGALAGGELTGVDYYRIRLDGVGVIDAREVVAIEGWLVSVRVDGYVLPPPGLDPPAAEDVMSPSFSWPDAPFLVRAAARFATAAPGLAHLNRAVVSHTGVINFADGTLQIEARQVGRDADDPARVASASMAH